MANPFREELQKRQGNQSGGTNPFRQEMQRRSGKKDQPLAFMNRAIADVLGAPVDLMNAAPMAVNILPGEQGVGPISDRPIGGSRSIQQAMQAGGVETPAPGEQPDTAAEYVARGVGEAAGAVVPFFGAASRASQAASPIVRGAGREMVESAVRRPGRTIAAETTAGAGAGAGAAVAREQAPESDAAEALGELAGGLSASLAPAAAVGAVRRTPVAGTAVRSAQRAVAPFTEAGGRIRASERVRSLSGDPEADAEAMRQESIGGLSPSQQTGNERLMALERLVLQEDAKLQDEFADASANARRQLREAMEEPGAGADVSDAQSFIRDRQERLITALDTRIKQASDKATQRIEQLEPQQGREQASQIVREEIDKAYRDARQQEKQLWDAIPDDVTLSSQGTRETYQSLADDLPRAQRDDIPDVARRFLDPDSNQRLKDQESVKEMRGLYSKLGEAERAALANGERNTARIAADLRSAILEDLGAAGGEGEVGTYIDAARDFSRRLNDRFTRGAVGRVRGYAREGGEQVPSELTLDRTAGKGGLAGKVETEQVLRGTGSEDQPSQQAVDSVREYLKNQFQSAAVREGQVRPELARRFIRNNREQLDQFQGLRQQMEQAAQARDTADDLAKRLGTRRDRLRSPSKSYTEQFLDAPVEREIEQVLKARNPRRAAQTLRNAVAKDKSGQAVRGLKSGFVDYLMRRAGTKEFDEQGERLISGGALKNQLSDPRVRNAMDALFTRDEMNRFRTIADELGKIEASRRNLPDVGPAVMDDLPSRLVDTVGRVLAARLGAAAGGSSMAGGLQSAQIFSGRAKEFIKNLTNNKAQELIEQAVTGDRELYRMLLMDLQTPGKRKAANRRLNAWLASPAGSAFAPEDAEQDDGGE